MVKFFDSQVLLPAKTNWPPCPSKTTRINLIKYFIFTDLFSMCPLLSINHFLSNWICGQPKTALKSIRAARISKENFTPKFRPDSRHTKSHLGCVCSLRFHFQQTKLEFPFPPLQCFRKHESNFGCFADLDQPFDKCLG